MQVKIKRLHPDAEIPMYAYSTDAGLDLTCTEILSENGYQITYGTGVAIEIPDGYVGLIFPRSSIRKTNLFLSNSVGVIDSAYRGEIQFTFNKGLIKYDKVYSVGDRIGQLIILPYPKIELIESDILSETDRGEGGFGSTGK